MMEYKNLYQVDWIDQPSRTVCFFASSEERVQAELVRLWGEDVKGDRLISLVAEGYSQIYNDWRNYPILED